MKTRKFCRENSKLQLLWELRERQLDGILGPAKGNPWERQSKTNRMNLMVTNNPNNDVITNKANNNKNKINFYNNDNNNNSIDTYQTNREDTPRVPANQDSSNSITNSVDKAELAFPGQAIDARRSYELDKIRRHKMEAAEDIERYKKEKLEKLQAMEEEKKRDLQMLTNYYPWGRSLGNFERTNYRRQKWNPTNNWPTKYENQPQEANSPSHGFLSKSLRWPHLNSDDGIHMEMFQPEKNKSESKEVIDKIDMEAPLDLTKDSNQGQENSLGFEQVSEQKILDSSSNGHKRKYATPDADPKYVGIISPRMKRSPSPSEVMRARAARVYMQELKKGMEEQRKKKEEMEKEVRAPMGELVTVMGLGKVGRPRRDPLTGLLLDNHLKTSDVSKEKIGKLLEENPTEKAKYGYDLIHAAEERYRLKELEKLKAKQQEIQHQATYNEIWGRPGGGAPRDSKFGNKMVKLNNVLYKDSLALNSNDIGKPCNESYEQRISPSVRYSTHQNHYDYPNNLKEFKDYCFRTPWASYY